MFWSKFYLTSSGISSGKSLGVSSRASSEASSKANSLLCMNNYILKQENVLVVSVCLVSGK